MTEVGGLSHISFSFHVQIPEEQHLLKRRVVSGFSTRQEQKGLLISGSFVFVHTSDGYHRHTHLQCPSIHYFFHVYGAFLRDKEGQNNFNISQSSISTTTYCVHVSCLVVFLYFFVSIFFSFLFSVLPIIESLQSHLAQVSSLKSQQLLSSSPIPANREISRRTAILFFGVNCYVTSLIGGQQNRNAFFVQTITN